MKLLVIGLDCAAPELLLGDDRLVNLRRLMAAGGYGRLESVVPPITVPAWMCLATSQDPGSLGVYGFRNRTDYSYGGLAIANSRSIQELAIWDQLARQGKQSVIIGVPPSFPRPWRPLKRLLRRHPRLRELHALAHLGVALVLHMARRASGRAPLADAAALRAHYPDAASLSAP